jgi:NADH:ubiquinone oxidoreductase subunit B-like Fe-S oxidoreductase
MGIEAYVGKTPLMPYPDKIVNWGRKYSIWPVTFFMRQFAQAEKYLSRQVN